MTTNNSFLVLHSFPEPRLESAWRDFLRVVELPSHYCAPEFFKEPFWTGKNPFAVLALKGGDVVGVVTGTHAGTEVQCGHSTRPQICLDLRTDVSVTLGALAEGLLIESGPAKIVSVYSWQQLDPLIRHGFRFRALEGDVMLRLNLGADVLFTQFHEGRRKTIRRAMLRFGVDVSEVLNPQDISSSYKVYLQWRQTKRKKIQWEEVPFPIFEEACKLRSNRRVFLASHAGKAIAVLSLRFYPRGLVEASGIHSVDDYLHLYPNELLHWRAIEWACREGFGSYSFGGAHTFLRRFGGEVVPVYRYRMDRTWLRHHDFRDTMSDWGRNWLNRIPKPVEQKVRRVLGRSRESH